MRERVISSNSETVELGRWGASSSSGNEELGRNSRVGAESTASTGRRSRVVRFSAGLARPARHADGDDPRLAKIHSTSTRPPKARELRPGASTASDAICQARPRTTEKLEPARSDLKPAQPAPLDLEENHDSVRRHVPRTAPARIGGSAAVPTTTAGHADKPPERHHRAGELEAPEGPPPAGLPGRTTAGRRDGRVPSRSTSDRRTDGEVETPSKPVSCAPSRTAVG